MVIHQHNKDVVARLRATLYDCEEKALDRVLGEVFAADCVIHLAHPFEDLNGPAELFAKAYRPLLAALPDLERRDYIVIGGSSKTGDWVGCAGYYIGVFEQPWLDIPATCKPVTMRFHEFFRLEEGRVVEMQALWDIPEVMLQARAWPLSPSLGCEWLVPGPAPQNGLVPPPYDEQRAGASKLLVKDMLTGLSRFAQGGAEAMNLAAYWHPKMTWYGPAGIGTNRRITGFRNFHQIPFLNALPDREGGEGENMTFLADGDYVGFTAWPGMRARVTGDGWLGIAPSGREITMRSLDFWRAEKGMLRENWVLVDLLDVYHQLGVDVFRRMRECTIDRQPHRPNI